MVPREKATNPYGQHDRKPDTAFPARVESGLAWLHTRRGPDSPLDSPEEPRDPCRLWRGNMRYRTQLQIRTSHPAGTSEESQWASCESRGDWTSLGPHERVPEVLILIREEHCHNSRRTRRFSPQRGMWPFSTAASRENASFHPEPRKGP